MENSALQRGPVPVLSTERSPPNLTAALTRLRRSFLDGSNFSRSLPVGFKPKLAGLFQGFEALGPGRQLARNVEGGLSRLLGQIGLAWRIFRHCIFRSGFANGYRNGI